MDEVFFGGFEVHRDDKPWMQFESLSTNHVRAEQVPSLGIEDGLNEAIGLASAIALPLPRRGNGRP